MRYDPIRSSVWRSNVHTLIGFALIGSCALWASLAIWHSATGENLLVTAFVTAMEKQTQLPQ